MSNAPIYVTSGMSRLVGGTITEANGLDISGDTVVMGLSASPQVLPSTWKAPTQITSGPVSVLKVLLLIDASVQPGTYWVWAKITDGQEVEPLMFVLPIRVE